MNILSSKFIAPLALAAGLIGCKDKPTHEGEMLKATMIGEQISKSVKTLTSTTAQVKDGQCNAQVYQGIGKSDITINCPSHTIEITDGPDPASDMYGQASQDRVTLVTDKLVGEKNKTKVAQFKIKSGNYGEMYQFSPSNVMIEAPQDPESLETGKFRIVTCSRRGKDRMECRVNQDGLTDPKEYAETYGYKSEVNDAFTAYAELRAEAFKIAPKAHRLH